MVVIQFKAVEDELRKIFHIGYYKYVADFVVTVEYYCSHDVVNINLMEKPDWFLQKNPDGKVPVIEHSGKVGKPRLRKK